MIKASQSPVGMNARELPELLSVVMNEASFIQVGGAVFSADYLHAPDEYTLPDDVLVEASGPGAELILTKRDFEGAQLIGQSDIVLADGTVVRFLRSASVH